MSGNDDDIVELVADVLAVIHARDRDLESAGRHVRRSDGSQGEGRIRVQWDDKLGRLIGRNVDSPKYVVLMTF